jgi:ABC-2 type transport system ATP-binding protein
MSQMTGLSISLRDLVKRYGRNRDAPAALDLEALDVDPGSRVGLVGNNGAGKTTLLRLLLDLIRPTDGTVQLGGHLVGTDPGWKHHVGAFLDSGFLVDYLHPQEYLHLVGGAYGLAGTEIDARLATFETFLAPALAAGTLIRDLSTGNANRVGIVGAMLPRPGLIVLDEPFANLDPGARFQLEALLRRESAEHGTTLLVSSHDLDHVVDVCDRMLVLADGRLVQDIPSGPGTRDALRAYFAGQSAATA